MNFSKTPVFLLLSIVGLAGCAYRQGEPGYGTAGSQVISAPPYTGAASSPGSAVTTSPPVYSGASQPAANAIPNEAPAVAADRNLVNRVEQSLRGSALGGLAPNVNVSALNGDVTLTGYVPSERDRQMAENLARNTPGVLNVDNEIRVVSSNATAYPPAGYSTPAYSPPAANPTGTGAAGDVFNLHVQGLNDTDRTLAQRILQGLRTDSTLASMLPSVNINVGGGRVVLQGQVQSEQQRQAIESVVRQAAGVNNVENQLQVLNSAAPSNP